MKKTDKINQIFNILRNTQIPVLTGEKETSTPILTHLQDRQLYIVALELYHKLNKSNLEQTIEFQKAFVVPQEATHVVENFKHKELRFRLILEECLELGKALGFKSGELYLIYRELADKVEKSEISEDIFNVADALSDILYTTYGAFYTFNLEEITDELFSEVHKSNMSKLVSTDSVGFMDTIVQSVNAYKEKDVNVVSVNLKNNYFSINHLESNKILKPVTYVEPNLVDIIEPNLIKTNKQ